MLFAKTLHFDIEETKSNDSVVIRVAFKSVWSLQLKYLFKFFVIVHFEISKDGGFFILLYCSKACHYWSYLVNATNPMEVWYGVTRNHFESIRNISSHIFNVILFKIKSIFPVFYLNDHSSTPTTPSVSWWTANKRSSSSCYWLSIVITSIPCTWTKFVNSPRTLWWKIFKPILLIKLFGARDMTQHRHITFRKS